MPQRSNPNNTRPPTSGSRSSPARPPARSTPPAQRGNVYRPPQMTGGVNRATSQPGRPLAPLQSPNYRPNYPSGSNVPPLGGMPPNRYPPPQNPNFQRPGGQPQPGPSIRSGGPKAFYAPLPYQQGGGGERFQQNPPRFTTPLDRYNSPYFQEVKGDYGFYNRPNAPYQSFPTARPPVNPNISTAMFTRSAPPPMRQYPAGWQPRPSFNLQTQGQVRYNPTPQYGWAGQGWGNFQASPPPGWSPPSGSGWRWVDFEDGSSGWAYAPVGSP